MSRGPLWRISVFTVPEAEDAVAELLGSAFGQPASSYTDVETRVTRVTSYFEKKPVWSAAKRARLRAGLQRIKNCGLGLRPGTISLGKVRRQDWAESWKRHFQPLEIGSALLIKPSWSRRRPRKGQAVVVLDPGLSFGTGQHPTTSFCLRQLVASRRPARVQSFLDIGTGSGILAIAAAKLGYAPVHGLDLDPDSVRIARANAHQNGVAARIKFIRQDAAKLARSGAGKYSVICANLISNLLLTERARILAPLAASGRLVLAGILKTEFPGVQHAYESAGLRLIASRAEGEWRSGSFEWPRRTLSS